MNQNKKIYLLFGMIVFIFLISIYLYTLHWPPWGDESHFVQTVLVFGDNLSLDTLKHYNNEMATPFSFILYSIWGRVFGFELHILRIFSIIIALVTYLSFFRLIMMVFNNIKVALFTSGFLILNPYMIGLSVFVFTDMLAILSTILICMALLKQDTILLFISLTIGLLTRQYIIFIAVAAGLYIIIRIIHSKTVSLKINISMLVSVILALIPLGFLLILWSGLSPANELRNIYLDEGLCFHISYLNLYTAQIFIYLFPFLFISFRKIYSNYKYLMITLIFSWVYWLFPVRACKYAIEQVNLHTVGFFHRWLNLFYGNALFNDIIFFLSFLIGLPVLLFIIEHSYSSIQNRHFDIIFFLDIAVLLFFLIMPFSYLCWEKYFLLIMPVAIIRLLLIKYDIKFSNH